MFDNVDNNHSVVSGGVKGEWVQEMHAIFAVSCVLIRNVSLYSRIG